MNKKYRTWTLILVLALVVFFLVLFLRSSDIAVLSPKGEVAAKERDLIVFTTLLMLIVVVPVFMLTFFIAWKYREGNKSAKYSPELDGNRLVELTWWAIPTVIILVLASVTWKATHELDPFRPLEASAKPIPIQVVALQWKWLFIYPDHGVASLNLVQFPEDTPINFEITADAPMNSFWIPKLGGQVYAMAGMKTKLHLISGEQGSFIGSSANISGRGFSGMRFTANATSTSEFEQWVESAKQSSQSLSIAEYNQLARPSQNDPPAFYSLSDAHLLDKIVMKFMSPAAASSARYSKGSYIHGHH